MPTVLIANGYRFFFYSNEGNPLEPCHIHVRKGAATAKFWIESQVSLSESFDMSPRELREIMKIIEVNKESIRKSWYDFFST